MDVTLDELRDRLGEEGLVLFDVRTRVEFEGVRGAPCDPRQGRIPGARHLDLEALGRCRTIEEVRALAGLPPGADVIAYCHSGNRSAHAVQILRAAGYGARNYMGSWHEWSRDPSLPTESGPAR